MGAVYRGLDTRIQRPVAVKIIRLPEACNPAETEELYRRFEKEALAAGKLSSHPNIVTIYEVDDEGGVPFIVMELVNGGTLEQRLTAGTPIDPSFVIPLIAQCAGALDYAHERGVVHRDVKPANIMLDEDGCVKLCDFGIAKIFNATATQANFTLGTPYYMPPEQVQGTSTDGRADQYSLAVVAYRMLTGQYPFNGESAESILAQVLFREPEPADKLNPALPGGVSGVLAKALSKDPAVRFPSCCAFSNELAAAVAATGGEGAAAVEVVSAPPRRSRRVAALIAAAAGVVITGIAIYLAMREPAVATGAIAKSSTVARPVLSKRLSLPAGEMVLIEAGPALIGKELRRVELPGFYLDVTEVSNRVYSEFCRNTQHPLPKDFPADRPGDPVVNVSFDDAQTFARWAGKRLPTAEEWEKAARGTDGRLYPWGNERRDAATLASDSVQPVDSHPDGVSPYGALNMCGNVWEWIDTPLVPEASTIRQFRLFHVLPEVPTTNERWYGIRGGAYDQKWSDAYLNDTGIFPARFGFKNIGFRCARDAR
jgi:serine/threonine-protein kinase